MSKTEEMQSKEYMPHGPARPANALRVAAKRPVENLQARAEAGDTVAAKELAERTGAQPPAPPAKTLGGPSLSGVPPLPGVFNTAQPVPRLGEKLTDELTIPAPVLTVEALVASVGGKMTTENVRGLIVAECRALEELLLEKNASYGNSALDPLRLFSHASPIEQLKVRIDDKISRIARGDMTKVKEEDLKVVTKDLLGYIILMRVAWRLGLE